MILKKRKSEKILELESRKNIYEIVIKHAGCHFREIERKSHLPYSTLKYHLNFLTKHELIFQQKENNKINYFPKDFQTKNLKLLSLLRQKSTRKIILFITFNDKCYHSDIARYLSLSQSTISWHLLKLINSNIIKADRENHKIKYSLAVNLEEIIKLLIVYKESFLDSLVNRAIEMWEVKG